jgi:hypothetical protein
MPAGQMHGVLGSLSWSYCGSLRLHEAHSVRRCCPTRGIASSPGRHWAQEVAGSVSVSAFPGGQLTHAAIPSLPSGLYCPGSQLVHGVYMTESRTPLESHWIQSANAVELRVARTVGSESSSVFPGGQMLHILIAGSKLSHIPAQDPHPAQFSSPSMLDVRLLPMISAAAHLPAPAP